MTKSTGASRLATTDAGGESRTRLRTARSALTRDVIVAAADRLFREYGYVGTSLAAIAGEAGVAVQTVYNAVGSKIDLLSAVLDAQASGPASPRTVPEFMADRSHQASDVDALIDILADWFVEVHARTAEIFALIRQAAALNPAAADLERARAARRLHNYGLAAAELRGRGAVPPGRNDNDIAAAIFALGHPETYRALVLDGGWPVAQYRSWLRDSLAGAVT